MSTKNRPELQFFLYSDPAEAKRPDNKKLVRVHVARISHAKTRKARTKVSKPHEAHGAGECVQVHGNRSDGQVVSRKSSPTTHSTKRSSLAPGVIELAHAPPSPWGWLPSKGPAPALVQRLSPEENFLLDYCEWYPEEAHHAQSNRLRQLSGQM